MTKYVSISSIKIPDALKPYQEAIDLIWTDNIQDVCSIAAKLKEFVQNNILSKEFIKTMLTVALDAKIKNCHLVRSIAARVFNLAYYGLKDPNPILWNDDVDTLVTRDLCEDDIAEAARYGAVKCFKVLIGKFSHFDEKLCENAIIGGNLEIIRILDRHLNFATERSVFVAISNHRNNILDWIIEKDPKLSKIDSSACLEFMNYQGLISQFPHYNVIYRKYYRPFIDLYPTSFFRALFDLGLNVDYIIPEFWGDQFTLLIYSAKQNNFEYVKFLVERGAYVNTVMSYNGGSTTTESVSALKFAVINDNVEMAKYLLNNGANANIKYRTQGCFHCRNESLLDIAQSQQMKNLLKLYIVETQSTEEEEESSDEYSW